MNEDLGPNPAGHLSEYSAELDRLRAILDSTTDAVASYDRSWRFTSVNHQVELTCGKTSDELVGRVLWDVFPYVLETPVLHPELVRAMETREPVQFEFRFEPTEQWTEVRAYPTSDGLTVYYRDITQRKRVEVELRASEELNRRIVEAAPAGIVHVDAQGSLVRANEQAQRLLGFSYDALTKRYVRDFEGETIWEDGSPCPTEEYPVTKCLRSGEPQSPVTLGIRRPDGGTVWAVFAAVPLTDPLTSAPAGAVVTFLDITERVRAESARQLLEQQLRHSQKMEAVGRLAGGIAHDFNNLLTVIGGYAAMLSRALGERGEVEAIQDAARRASALTRRLLAFSRGQTSRPELVDLNVVVRDMASILRRLIGEDIELVTELGDGLGSVLVAPDEVEQTVANLAVNARDAMPSGGTLSIRTANQDALRGPDGAVLPGRYVTLSVGDTGTGMDDETLLHSFEPFFTTKAVGKGTGLGLTVVYGIVTRAGGHVDVKSEPGCGTTFTIHFPRAEGAPRPAAFVAESAELRPGSETVLVVEDEEAVRRLACDSLVSAGYRVLEAGDGEEGLALAERFPETVHAVVTDVVMPRMSGPHLASRLASTRPETRVLFISGYVQDEGFRRELADGKYAFLPKPFAPGDLLVALRSLLDG